MEDKSFNQYSDNQLVERYRHSHNNRYVGVLYNRYSHLVLGLCIKYFKDQNRAEDATMSIFELVMKELKKHDISYFKSWLYTVSKNYCLQELRKEQVKRGKVSAYESFYEDNMESDEDSTLNIEKEQLLRRLEELIPTLTYNQQQCIRLFYLEGKTYADITDITGYSLKEVKSYIQNGKRNLKIKLEDRNNG